MDYGYKLTDKKLAELEKKISDVYTQAAEQQRKIAEDYFKQFKVKDELMRKAVEAGTITDEYYKDWRLANIGRGERFVAMRDDLAERATRANEVAMAYVNDATPSIWSLNANYAAYTIENYAGNVGFTLYDENAIERLLVEEPDVMPFYPPQRAVDRGIDLAYGKRQITAQVTSSILTGDSIGHMADALMTRITTMERSSAIRAARTASTNAMNAGRQMQFEKASAMGIRVKKRWRCVHDARTREEHGDADGQIREIKEPYDVGGEKLMFPADNAGSGWNVYNCRCRSENFLPDYPRDMGETYNEWLNGKIQSGEIAPKPEKKKSNVLTEPKKDSKDSNYTLAIQEFLADNVTYNPVLDAERILTEEEIISVLSGGDRTSGSCASLGLAYIGQKQGWNVIDYRGGQSQRRFSGSVTLRNISNMEGFKTLKAAGKSSLTVGNRLLQQCELNKEYYLASGRHVSIVRMIERDITSETTGEVLGTKKVYQYLELQSATTSGWTDFNGNAKYTLNKRFGCTSTSDYGSAERNDFMIDIEESKFDTEEFRSLLGFLNTAENEQKKGRNGTIK